MVHDTPSHGSDHLCLIWKESIHNCRWYRADTACGTDGRTDGRTDRRTDRRTDGRTDGVKPVYPPTTSLCGGYKYTNGTYIICIFIFQTIPWNKLIICEEITHYKGTWHAWGWMTAVNHYGDDCDLLNKHCGMILSPTNHLWTALDLGCLLLTHINSNPSMDK